MAIVIDDFNLSFESAGRMRKALTQFITQAVQPGDLVTIVRTGQSGSRFQEFTSDHKKLLAAARLRDNIMSAAGDPSREGGRFRRETLILDSLHFSNINDLGGAMARMLEDQRGYYLIGYQPDDQTFKADDGRRARFHPVTVRATRTGARV